MGIFEVSIGSGATGFTNPTTGGAADGYQDYSCLKQATVLEGVATTISVSTNPNTNENVRVWMDINNNGTFEAASELIFSSNNAKVHSGTFTIPVAASVIKNTVLRVRISADNFSSPIPTPCSAPAYSQVEDYGITVLPNLNKPATDFTTNNPITCSPTVQFTNLVQNGATSYLWSFGDGTTSTAANPSKTYASTGTYTIKLKACNANGCDSLTKSNYVTYHTNVPVAASCTPTTTSYCCGYGITKVTFHTIINSSQNGSVGYEDFTCTNSVTVTEGVTYPVAIETGLTNLHDTWIYIDYNNDGIFSSNELVFTKLNAKDPAGTIMVGTTSHYNTPLRMRVISDAQGSQPGPCTNRTSGQAEDYTIIISPTSQAPTIAFTSSFATSCDTLVQFTDRSANAPTSWRWDFGDGSPPSTLQNPVHNYTANGIYTVSLRACNAIGCDSLTKVSYITVKKPCLQYCIPQGNGNWFFINNFNFGDINNTTGAEPNAYGNYTHLTTSVVKGSSYTATIGVNRLNFTRGIVIWIDFNQDGDFDDAGEQVVYSHPNTNFPTSTAQITIPVTAKSGTTRMRMMLKQHMGQIDACKSYETPLETEDYSILILPNNLPPTANFFVNNPQNCTYNVIFRDNSSNSPTTWLWNFGDPASGASNTSTLEDPSHTFSAPGTYTVTLTVCNSFGCNTITKTNYITVSGNTGPRNAACFPKPSGTTSASNYAIITLNTINSNSTGFNDFSCTKRTTLIQGISYPLRVFTSITGVSVRVWIDYNNDGIFDPVSERVLDSDSTQTHTALLIPPPTAVLHTPLRMRLVVAGEFSLKPMPCGQEGDHITDFAVTIVPNTNAPAVDFSASATANCGEQIVFADSSGFLPTSWTWNFGDPASGTSNTSNLQNPRHTYTTPGTYTVTLTACNANGCNTLTKTAYITTTNNINIAAACRPQSLWCIINGIRKVNFLSINSNTGDCSEGYQDLTCTRNAQTVAGLFPLRVENGLNNEDVQVWIDFNNDGQFTVSERVMHSQNARIHNAMVFIPDSVVKNTWFRMRVMSVWNYPGTPGPCDNPNSYGQVEDYAIKVIPNTAVPTVSFTADKTNTCATTINFTESSFGATSWSWNFGDPASGTTNTSALREPSHTFSGPGTYTITLTACNAVGCTTIVQNAMITIANLANMPTVCQPITTIPVNIVGITNVSFGSINNTSSGALEGNPDFSCDHRTEVIAGNFYPISVTAPSLNIGVWIDYDHDGTFSATEKVMHSFSHTTHNATITIPANATLNTYLRMRVMVEDPSDPFPAPCTNLVHGQYEDYAIIIRPNTSKPIAGFTKTSATVCDPNVAFTDISTFAPTSWAWNFGDPGSGTANTSTLQSPSHIFSATGTYPVRLIACNAFGCDTATLAVVINPVISIQPAACKPATSNYCCDYGITSVKFGTINNSSNSAAESYKDFSCRNNTTLGPGTHILQVETGSLASGGERVKGWIDYNNDGIFSNNELIINTSSGSYHSASVTFPATAVRGAWLRMRIMSDDPAFPIQTACSDPERGQAEDYAVKILPVSGIMEKGIAELIRIYPNPSTGTFFIDLPDTFANDLQIGIQNTIGQEVFKGSYHGKADKSIQLNLNHLAKGIYLVKFHNSELSFYRKIVIE